MKAYIVISKKYEIGKLYREPLGINIHYNIAYAILNLDEYNTIAEVELKQFWGKITKSFVVIRILSREYIVDFINKSRFIKDFKISTRRNIARYNVSLHILINDESPIVRGEVALKGYGVDRLIDDKNEYVRKCANFYIENFM